jgi:hypothetical protein
MTPCVFSDQLHGGSPIRRRLRSIHGQQVELTTLLEGLLTHHGLLVKSSAIASVVKAVTTSGGGPPTMPRLTLQLR